MYTHILISTDGSALAQRGVDHGLSLARTLGSKVTIITVTEPLPVLAMGDGAWALDLKDYEADQAKLAEGVLSIVRASAAKMGLEVKTVHVANSHPASAIVGRDSFLASTQRARCGDQAEPRKPADLFRVAGREWEPDRERQ